MTESKELTVTDRKILDIKDLIKTNMHGIKSALTNTGVTPERLARVALTTLRQNPKLLSCDKFSFMGALMQSAQLGLEPNTLGESWIIPYKDQATFQIGYKGLIKLAYRSGLVELIDAHEVYEKDTFSFNYGLDPKLEHKPSDAKDKGKVIYFYAFAKMTSGKSRFVVMSKAEVEAHRDKYSRAKNSPAWVNNFIAMGKKTALVQVFAYVPLAAEIQDALRADNTIKAFDENDPDALHGKDLGDKFETEKKKEITVDVANHLKDAKVETMPKAAPEPIPAEPKNEFMKPA